MAEFGDDPRNDNKPVSRAGGYVTTYVTVKDGDDDDKVSPNNCKPRRIDVDSNSNCNKKPRDNCPKPPNDNCNKKSSGGKKCNVASRCGAARPYLPKVTNSMKWWLAIFLGFLFFLIAYGGTYNFTNYAWTCAGLPSYLCGPGCPTVWGVVVHAIIFILIIRLILF